jgi:hypothetical protein
VFEQIHRLQFLLFLFRLNSVLHQMLKTTIIVVVKRFGSVEPGLEALHIQAPNIQAPNIQAPNIQALSDTSMGHQAPKSHDTRKPRARIFRSSHSSKWMDCTCSLSCTHSFPPL